MPDIADIANPTRQRLEAGELAVGMIVRVSRTGDVARIARSSGMDFLFIDAQHAIYSRETIAHIGQIALGCGITAMVRVRSCRDPDIPVLLDGGITGIVFPDVNTAEDAQAGVNAARYAPIGRRSATSGYALFDYRPLPQAEAIAIMNRSTLVVCMIETVEGVANAEAIAAVEGVDVILIGLTDLLTSMGKPGQLGDPEAMAAVERVGRACKAQGKFFGVGGDGDPQRQAIYISHGSRFIPTQSDAAFLMAAASRTTQELRALKP
ncbi:aldolase/citrate lyase family protein [Ancylobacter sp. MQZ15Z-1]|uniref:Aldolase/citrate lyase family protein n=1 Tax=Ancylobacter mangrovi TaxID=2972472 RepID=A0A9X2PE34_9HYPH|nr:aldolase/citrate lyase family protein [Ancylobacter mangrovi]MCS0494448.1 aldolase/citrate lyase family protein [Ancylobacter mangrovi]